MDSEDSSYALVWKDFKRWLRSKGMDEEGERKAVKLFITDFIREKKKGKAHDTTMSGKHS